MYLCTMRNIWYGNSFRFGLIGGGQLGRMLIQEAINFDVNIHVLDNDVEAPCKSLATSFTHGAITDYETVYQFGKDKDLITIEIENVNVDALEQLEKEGKEVYPQPHILRLIKDKGLQKSFYQKHGIPTAPFYLVQSKSELSDDEINFPYVQKLRTGGYDGKGVQIIKTKEDLIQAFDAPSVIEQMIPFDKELSVIVARNKNGETKTFPVVECEFNPDANLVELLFSPANISQELEKKASELAIQVIDQLGMIGILAVEFFLTKEGDLLVNEIAPRPHNSGHHTIECNVCSQFEQHLRSVLNLPLGDTSMIQAGAMINLLGEVGYNGPVFYSGLEKVIGLKGVQPHIYGKTQTKPFRKMGHITITDDTIEKVLSRTKEVQKEIRVISI